jgi:hypothetical protein
MVFASALPALVQSILKATPVSQIPYNGLIFSVLGILVALLISWVLFEAIYFAVILLLEAEINSFYAEDIHATPDNVAVMVHQLTSHMPGSEKDLQEQATPSHKDQEPQDRRPESEAKDQTTQSSQPAQSQSFPEHLF